MPVSTQGSLLDGRYRVLRHLGSGGMASVLLCRDERLDRHVAVKRLHADSPADTERRFAREAKLGASLNHPNLVSVFDTATDDEGVLIVMEFVDGDSLARALRRGPLDPDRVARMARDLGAALDHAHAHGVVHRDVKPGNVLLRRDGVTKLVDLGIATAADQTRITRSGIVLGTAAYMAPEQLEGRETGPAADVYALSAVCFEALSGRRARSGRTPIEIATRIATEPPPDLRDDLPGTPAAVAQALRRGMAREPDERTDSAGRLASELAGALEEPTGATRRLAAAPPPAAPPPTARPPTAPPPGGGPPPAGPPTPGFDRRPRRKRPVGAIAVAAVLLVLVAAAVAAAVLTSGGDDDGDGAPPRADRQERPAGSQGQAGKEKPKQQKKAKPEQQAPAPAPEPEAQAEPEPEQPEPEQQEQQPAGPARGAELNDQGFALIQQGDYAGAVPILQEAVASWPDDSRELTYAYALFNLGQALNRSGSPDEAIPYLEKRLTWDDQRDAVQAELDLARRSAEQG